jgi:hypothetical protein
MSRSTSDVFRNHLQLREEGKLDEDLELNYSETVVLIHEHGTVSGRDGVRELRERLRKQLPGGTCQYLTQRVEGEYAFLLWRASSAIARIDYGVDTFVIRDGRIVMQTVHYHLQRQRQPRVRAATPVTAVR